jgi:hypothetical protein
MALHANITQGRWYPGIQSYRQINGLKPRPMHRLYHYAHLDIPEKGVFAA